MEIQLGKCLKMAKMLVRWCRIILDIKSFILNRLIVLKNIYPEGGVKNQNSCFLASSGIVKFL